MAHPISEQTRDRKYPFVDMKITDNSILNQIEGRSLCTKCSRSRKFFCYTCYIPVAALSSIVPKINIPVKVDIIKHKNEIDGKSTAVHAPILAPDDCRIFSYPDIPDYSKEEGVVLIYPGAKSVTVKQLFNDNIHLAMDENFGKEKGFNIGTLLRTRVTEILDETEDESAAKRRKMYDWNELPVKRAVFIDSTWNQSRGIYKDERICSLKSVVLQNRASQFWRHQKGSPRWYLATIEAVHEFLLEVHINAWGLNQNYRGLDNLEVCGTFFDNLSIVDHDADSMGPTDPYNGQYDNLLYFFSNMYDLIHKYYDHNDLKSYKRPI